MTYVPMVHVPPPPSQRARDLSEKLRVVIDEFRRDDPSLSASDINQALQLAAVRGKGGAMVAVVSVLIVFLIAAGILFAVKSGQMNPPPPLAFVLGVGALAAVAAAIFAAARR